MSVVTKTFSFSASAEGLVDEASSADLNFAFNADHIEYTCAVKGLTDEFEDARVPTVVDTWEDWGVWVGGTVTDVQILDLDRDIDNANAQCEASSTQIRIGDDSDVAVTTLGLFIDSSFADETGWQAQGAQTSRAVNASYQESTQLVGLMISQSITTDQTGPNPAWVYAIRNLDIEITFTGGTPPAGTRFVHVTSILVGLGLVGLQAQLFRVRSSVLSWLFKNRKTTVRKSFLQEAV